MENLKPHHAWIGVLLTALLLAGFMVVAQTPSQQAESCRSCHAAKFDKGSKYSHPPVVDCLGCHKSHGNIQNPVVNQLLLGDPTVLCQEPCHTNMGRSHTVGRSLRNPTSGQPMDVTCTSQCHDPHGSEYKNILRMSARDLCFSCHNL